VNYGFVIDNRKCIGCHACSTACKSENEVPLGVHRTWVKTVEHGRFPDVTRSFQVSRCNHCANPPCARICPVTAMYQRADGIVEFDSDACIGCKACLQACPYDAIHIDPSNGTAAKCHFCAHRVEIALEPACVVVCPEHAILAGDLDDPASEISRAVAANHTTVRKPEQGTAPKLLYIDGDDVALHPTVFASAPAGLAASDVVTRQGASPARAAAAAPRTAPSGAAIRAPAAQGLPAGGPIALGGGPRVAGQMAQVAWNAQHAVPWHWQVPAYLVTKGLGAGIFLFLVAGWAAGAFPFDPAAWVWGGLLSVAAILATTALLISDLERPERFLRILLRPQWKSWLARGAYLLVAFATVSGLWWALEAAHFAGAGPDPAGLRVALGALTLPLAAGAAVYTAFLFAQAEGRDLWQSPLLPMHMLIQATFMGAGGLLFLSPMGVFEPALVDAARVTFAAALAADLGALLLGEFGVPHASELAARAAHEITHGRYRRSFWGGAVVAGHLLPLALIVPGADALGAAAAVCATVGLYLYEYAFVMAPQELPNS